MILKVRVVPRSSRSAVLEVNGGALRAYVTRPAHDGQANAQLLELLADYLKVKKYQLTIVSGEKSRDKRIAVLSI